MSNKLTTEQVLKQFTEVHGNRYDYSKVNYQGNKVKVEIVCKKHGSFWQTPDKHKRTNNCPKCSLVKPLKSTTTLVNQFKHTHGDLYDYSKVNYINHKTKVEIICKLHGSFWQIPGNHIQGATCGRCSGLGKSNGEWIAEFENVHSGKYDYRKVVTKGNNSKVTVLCKTHGAFEVTPNKHLMGRGCPKCVGKNLTLDEVKNQCNITHNYLYDYSFLNKTLVHSKVDIVCKTHGVFQQTLGDHKQGAGCPKCSKSISKSESEISDWIGGLGFEIETNKRGLFKNNRLEADILINSKKIIIEYNGSIWHSEKFSSRLYNIFEKTKMANEAGYRCIHIREDQYLENPNKIKALLKTALGIYDNKIGARETVKKEISLDEYRDLCFDHLQGYRSVKHKKGLFYKGVLLACIGYNDSGELIRYVIKNGWLIQGALPKLLKNEKVTFSFCDLSFFTGQSYIKAGFTLDCITKPNYVYVKSNVIRSRQQMMKHKLSKYFDNFNPNQTEVENCNKNGWFRLFDAGNAKFTREV